MALSEEDLLQWARWADRPFLSCPQLCIWFRKGTLPGFVSSKLVLIRSLTLISGILPPGRWTDQLLASCFKGILFLFTAKEHAGPVYAFYSMFSRTDTPRLILFFLDPAGFFGFAVQKRISCWVSSPREVWLRSTLRRLVARRSAHMARVLA